MPKEILKIDKFEGGINNSGDPKDIDITEVVDAKDAYFGKVGQVSTLGEAQHATDIEDVGNKTVTAGYGLASFQTGHSATLGESGSYTYWQEPIITYPTNGIEPNFTIKLGNFSPSPIIHTTQSEEMAQFESDGVEFSYHAPSNTDIPSCKDNWGFRIHIGSDPYGTPDKSFPSAEANGSDTTKEVTFQPMQTSSAKTITYHLIQGKANNESGSTVPWIKMLPDFTEQLTNDGEIYFIPTNRWFFRTRTKISRWSSQEGLAFLDGSETEYYELANASPPTGYGMDGKSNLLLAIAGVINNEPDMRADLFGEDDNFHSINVYINKDIVGGDFTPSNKYIWVEYRHYSSRDYTVRDDLIVSASMHEGLITEPYGMSWPSVQDSNSDGLVHPRNDYNFLNIPQRLDTDHYLYNDTTPPNYQKLLNLPSNDAVTNLLSDGLIVEGWIGLDVEMHHNTNFTHDARRVMPGRDFTNMVWLSALKESDGGDNAISGETYGVKITGPTIDTVFTASQVYAATGNDQLTEIAATLASAITGAYGGSELVTQNPDFAAGTGWTTGTGWSIGSGVATCASNTGASNALYQTIALDTSTYYKLEVTVTRTGGILAIDLGDTDANNKVQVEHSGTYVFIIKTPSAHPGGTERVRFYGDADFRGSIDNVSIKACTGGVPGLVASVPSGAQLKIATNGIGSAGNYQVETFIEKSTSHAYKEQATEMLCLVDSNSDLLVADTGLGSWSGLFNNNNAHTVISSFADGTDGDTTDTEVTTSSAHGLTNGDIVSIKGTSNYDGIYAIDQVGSTTTFDIEAAYVSETAASTMTVTKLATGSVNNRNTLLWPNSGAKLQTYANNGVLRLSDTNFDNKSNKSAWLGYIDKPELFNQSGTTLALDVEGWYVLPQKKEFASTPTDWINSDWNQAASNAEESNKMYIKISASGSTGEWTSTNYKFYACAMFDDGTETLPDDANTLGLQYQTGGNYYIANDGTQQFNIEVGVDPVDANNEYIFDERMTGIHIYYSLENEGHGEIFSFGKIDFKNGFIRADGGAITPWTALGTDSDYDAQIASVAVQKEFRGITFDLNNNYSHTQDLLPEMRWKCATVVGNRAFIGNVIYNDGLAEKHFPSRMVGSIPTQVDNFVIPGGILEFVTNDGDEIIQLENFSDRVLQYKRNSLFIINVSTYGDEFMEEEHKWKGISNPHHVIWTPMGVIWANEYSLYIYDGREVTDLMVSTTGAFKDKRIISRDKWQDFFSTNSVMAYDPFKNLIIIKRSDTGSASLNSGDIYVFDIDAKNWSFGKDRFITNSATDNPKTTNANTLADGRVYIVKGSDVKDDGRYRNINDKTEAGLAPTGVVE